MTMLSSAPGGAVGPPDRPAPAGRRTARAPHAGRAPSSPCPRWSGTSSSWSARWSRSSSSPSCTGRACSSRSPSPALGNIRAVLDDPVLLGRGAQHRRAARRRRAPDDRRARTCSGYYVAQKPPGHRVLRYLLFIPGLISTPAKAMVVLRGPLPGRPAQRRPGQGRSGLARPTPGSPRRPPRSAASIVLDVWSGIGFTAVLFAARLGSVPDEIGEAAQLDGAGHWRAMWRIHFPVIT